MNSIIFPRDDEFLSWLLIDAFNYMLFYLTIPEALILASCSKKLERKVRSCELYWISYCPFSTQIEKNTNEQIPESFLTGLIFGSIIPKLIVRKNLVIRLNNINIFASMIIQRLVKHPADHTREYFKNAVDCITHSAIVRSKHAEETTDYLFDACVENNYQYDEIKRRYNIMDNIKYHYIDYLDFVIANVNTFNSRFDSTKINTLFISMSIAIYTLLGKYIFNHLIINFDDIYKDYKIIFYKIDNQIVSILYNENQFQCHRDPETREIHLSLKMDTHDLLLFKAYESEILSNNGLINFVIKILNDHYRMIRIANIQFDDQRNIKLEHILYTIQAILAQQYHL